MEKIPRDFYPTPGDPVDALMPHLVGSVLFHEPCAGDGTLVRHLMDRGHSPVGMTDIEPRSCFVGEGDAMALESCYGNMFITNPPYTWSVLSPMISHLSSLAITWLLLPADMAHNKRMAPHMARCASMVSVGRVKWFNNKTGMENSAWYQFCDHEVPTIFYGRK